MMVSTTTLSQEVQEQNGAVHVPNTAGPVRLELIAKQALDYNVNTLTVGKPFRYPFTCLITGGEDGTIRVYKIKQDGQLPRYQEFAKLETKGGPLQCLCLHNTTKFGSCDLIAGDAKGMLTILCNEQILNRRSLSEGCISALAVDEDFAGNLAIVVGDNEGVVTAVSPYSSLWKLRMLDACKHTVHRELGVAPSVKCMMSVRLQTSSGVLTNYLLITDSCQNLVLLQNGMVVFKLQVPSVVTAMTGGYFHPSEPPQLMSPSQAFGSPRRHSVTITRQSQVALGTEDGSIFVFSDFQLHPYASVQLPVTCLVTLANEKQSDRTDFLLCAGHFNALMVFQQQELVLRHDTHDWIHTIACVDTLDKEGSHEVVLGLRDNSIQTYEMKY